MKKLLITLITIILLKFVSISQDTIIWNFTSKMDTNLVNRTLKITNINTNDSIQINNKNYKLSCITEKKAFINFEQKNNADTFILKFCKEIIEVALDIEKSIQIFKDDNIIITLRSKTHAVKPKLKNVNLDDYINSSDTNSKNIYYDANLLLIGDTINKYKILKKYNVDDNNQFLKSFAGILKLKSIQVSSEESNRLENSSLGESAKSSNATLLSSILDLDITNYADGLAKFFVSRVKEELAVAYFNKFNAYIRDTNIRDVQILFQNTYTVLDLVADRVYDFKPYLNTIRDGMEEDFKKLPESFNTLLSEENSQLYKAIDTIKNARLVSTHLLSLFKSIKENDHIGTAIANLDPGQFLDHKHSDTALIGALQSLQLFSEAFKDTLAGNDSVYWVSKEKISQLINNADFLNCFLGLVTAVAKEKNIYLGKNLSLSSILNDTLGPTRLKEFKTLFNSLKSTYGKIQTIHNKFKTVDDEELKGSLIADYFDAAHSLISNTQEVNRVLKLNQKTAVQNLISVSNDLNGVVKNISLKKYSVASAHLAHFFKEVASGYKDWRWYKLVNFLVEKSLFVSQMAEAESSDQVDSLLQIYAAPIGSWRDKRNAKWNIALDSYVGVGGFYSEKKSVTNQDKKEKEMRYNISSPVGLSLSKSIGNYTATFLFSAVDIGPITAFRFKNDTSEVPKISLNEIISPGIQTSLHFGRKFPITFNAGYQSYPLLSKISTNSNEYNLSQRPGFTFNINMNIPLLTLVNIKKDSKEVKAINNFQNEHLSLNTDINKVEDKVHRLNNKIVKATNKLDALKSKKKQ